MKAYAVFFVHNSVTYSVNTNSIFLSKSLQVIGEKRPAPVDPTKKPKTPKKKKKKDPNEPQKPVSAYALFFRDTQAAIKGQNPNATFGEVSKIVASMWDGLGEEQKQVRRESFQKDTGSSRCHDCVQSWVIGAKMLGK